MKLLLWSALLPLCAGLLCPPNLFWSNKMTKCVECSRCKNNQVTLRPCQPHKDTVCGPISQLKIDWSWLPKEKVHHLEKDRLHLIKEDEPPGHIDVNILDSYNTKPSVLEPVVQHHDKTKERFQNIELRFEGKTLADKSRLKHHHKDKKHFEYPPEEDDKDEVPGEKKQRKNSKFRGRIPFPSHQWESEGTDYPKNRRKHIRFDDEKQLENWLLMSQIQLLNRKAHLMKTLKEEHGESSAEGGGIKLNHPIHRLDAKLYQDLLDHESHSNKTKKHRKHMSDTDLKIFQDLLKDERDRNMDFMSVLSESTDDTDFKSVGPNSRMFLGEPSTVSEIIGQVKDPQEVIKEDIGKDLFFENRRKPVVDHAVTSIPFTAAEKFVWDWQAVAFISAGLSFMFFVIAAIYTILNARQWRKVKIKYDTDLEEMSSKLALMPSSIETSASEGNSTGLYLEQLLATKNLDERKGNIYLNNTPGS